MEKESVLDWKGVYHVAKSNATNKISSGDIFYVDEYSYFVANRSRLCRAKYGMLVNAFYDDRHFDMNHEQVHHNLLDEQR